MKKVSIILFLLGCFDYRAICQANKFGVSDEITVSELKMQVSDFVGTELQATLDAVKRPEAMPSVLFGEPTEGGTNYISLANTLSSYHKLTGSKTIGSHNIDEWVRFFLLKEVRADNTAFSQLYVAQILLRNSGDRELSSSALWNSFNTAQQDSIIGFLNLDRLYDSKKDDILGGRPNNYYGVALLLAAYNHRLGIGRDKKDINLLFNKSFDILKKSNGFLDDSKNYSGSFDRYHHEFIRFLWKAAVLVNDHDIQRKLLPIVKRSGKLWWDLFSADVGHSSAWGRSLQISWDDTFEQTAFFSENPELSPASKPLLASAFLTAYNYYINNEYNFKTHLNRMLDFGRGTYSYAGRNRLLGYTLGTLGKLTLSVNELAAAFKKSKVDKLNTNLNLPDVCRFETFRSGERTYGVWAYRKNNRSFALPVVGNGITSDYLPVLYGIPGVEAPVAQHVSNLVPVFELENNLTLSTAQGADSVTLDPEKNIISLYWKQLSNVKGERSTTALYANTTWRIEGSNIRYTLQFNVDEDMQLKNFRFWIPSGYPDYDLLSQTLYKQKDSLKLNCKSNFKITQTIESTQAGDVGKGAFHSVPLILRFESDNLFLQKTKVYKLEIDFYFDSHSK